MKVPKPIQEIAKLLEKAGYEAFLVGGCVRDMLQGIVPTDYDMTTNATPDEMKGVFSDFTFSTIGSAFGTIGVKTSLGTVEITTFRKDGTYKNHRKPEEVLFSNRLEDDLSRRDFTINSMAWSEKTGLVDLYSGVEDLSNRILRTVGNPAKRFEEDALRILRGIRFIPQLNLQVEKNTFEGMKVGAYGLKDVSSERISSELQRLLLCEKPSRGFYIMEETGVLSMILPELIPTIDYNQMTPYHDKTLFDHIMCVVDHVPAKVHVRYAALFHDIEKPNCLTIGEDGRGHFYGHDTLGSEGAKRILTRLNTSKKLQQQVSLLILNHMKNHSVMTDKALRRQIKRLGEDLVLDLYDLMIADQFCTRADRNIEDVILRKKRVEELLHDEGVLENKSLCINGKDIIAVGGKESPEVGVVLEKLLDVVMENPSLNNREYLLSLAKQWLKDRSKNG